MRKDEPKTLRESIEAALATIDVGSKDPRSPSFVTPGYLGG